LLPGTGELRRADGPSLRWGGRLLQRQRLGQHGAPKLRRRTAHKAGALTSEQSAAESRVPCPRLFAWACLNDMPTKKRWAWHPALGFEDLTVHFANPPRNRLMAELVGEAVAAGLAQTCSQVCVGRQFDHCVGQFLHRMRGEQVACLAVDADFARA